MDGDPAEIWRRLATWYDAAVGEGNDFQTQLVMPATDRLLAVRAGERVLDVACGNGNYARRLAAAGAEVVAFDVAPDLIEAARRRGVGRIVYHVADATSETELLALGRPGTFDAAVCSMALMDLPTIEPLVRALGVLLSAGGRFVFSIPHPCFNSPQARMTAELATTADGWQEQTYSVTTSRYLTETTVLSAGLVNQPEPNYIYHRPLGRLVGTFAANGFVLDAAEEPAFPPGRAGGGNAFSWKARPELPPVLVGRVVRRG